MGIEIKGVSDSGQEIVAPEEAVSADAPVEEAAPAEDAAPADTPTDVKEEESK